MNWLAHAFLSENKTEFQLGNILADPMKGRSWPTASKDIKKGMNTHFLIDSFTDSHEIVKQSKNRLREKGIMRSIVIDLAYDYFLTKNWNTFALPIKSLFLEDFNYNASNYLLQYPEKPKDMVLKLVNNNVLDNNNSLDELKKSLEGIDKRLLLRSITNKSALAYFDKVVENEHELEQDFMAFFPELCLYVKQHLNEDFLTHWK